MVYFGMKSTRDQQIDELDRKINALMRERDELCIEPLHAELRTRAEKWLASLMDRFTGTGSNERDRLGRCLGAI
jgi:hypothetical protein